MPAWRTTSPYLVLALLVAVSTWLAEKLTPPEENGTRTERSAIDYYSKNIQRTVLSLEGKPVQTLYADLMTHYQNDDRTDMENPKLTLYQEGKSPWLIEAQQATVLSRGEAVLLKEQVIMRRETDQGTIQIFTRNVKYDPQAEYAETDEDIIIKAPTDETHATGMQVHFKPQLNFTLLANVRRKHEMR